MTVATLRQTIAGVSVTMTRSWIAQCQYRGLAPFWIGTVMLRSDEGSEAARTALEALIRETMPTMPDVFVPVPGAVFVTLEDEK